jgi:hypothetical protein
MTMMMMGDIHVRQHGGFLGWLRQNLERAPIRVDRSSHYFIIRDSGVRGSC